MQAIFSRSQDKNADEDSEPPPDLLAECDSEDTIAAVGHILEERHRVYYIESDQKAYTRLRRLNPDLVFNISERLFGPNRESHIPTICEMLGLSYTGSDPLTLGICLDKSRTKEILSHYGVPNPPFTVVENPVCIPANFPLPAIIKPLYEGSSKGIKNDAVVRSRKALRERSITTLQAYRQPVIIEQFLPGREFTAGVLGNNPDYEILPVVEIDYSELPAGAEPIYSYEAKWIWDTPDRPLGIFHCPATIPARLEQKIREIVCRTCTLLRIKDWCRIDLRLDGAGEPNVIEVNPLPGILPRPEDNSCLPKAARAAGYTYRDLINRVVDEALKRNRPTGTKNGVKSKGAWRKWTIG